MSLIQAEGLTKRFGTRTAIQDVSLDVPQGVCFGFLGPNGAGKTTLIRLMLGLARPTAGRVLIGGVDVNEDPREALKRVGAIVEEPRFHLHMTGIENLRVHAAIADPASVARIDEVLDRVGLLERGKDKVKGYSLGMRQRLGVARAMMTSPDLLILDEPSNGLDAEGMAEFRRLVRELVDDQGRTVFISSHLLDEMEKLCDEVAIVEHGRVVERSSVRELIADAGIALILEVDDPARARELLEHPSITIASDSDGTLRLMGVGEREQAMAIVRRLVEHGVGIVEVRRDKQSLEQRYLDITRGGGLS